MDDLDELNAAKIEALEVAECIELETRINALTLDLRKWTRQRIELERKCEQLDLDNENPELQRTERNLQQALSLIVNIVGEDDMLDLMAGIKEKDEKGDKKLVQKLKRHGKGGNYGKTQGGRRREQKNYELTFGR
mmetsp:Transcript_35555/g.95444  ORF Transcript_35555/g.95444 Transcript_35555/m.95444 type:complete len:135 (-) Transcript_35555:516-920(-)|eukprot:CAMPEP_0119527968 /NCGR_PEP_ID=MMETSP1344-20130328/42251_1 /TAXON_ID=236787 /ORGANISM="Florenciella parvula, Strain CCMP2471" /LENGTH=134 /DNA_ID=CAMNT_0007567259 /DNA_START=262 /DNA_END=666 /DNA_ORIENTATION=-